MPAQEPTRRSFVGASVAMSLHAAAVSCRAGARPPNVLLIVSDDQGTLDLRCYGSRDLDTPNLDRLARRGIRFTQAYAHTVCCPSRAALLTGRYPQRCGVNDWLSNHPSDELGRNMNAEEVTLAGLLRAAGYRTGIFGKWHLGAKPGFGPRARGFDEFFGHLGGFIDYYQHRFLHAGKTLPPFHDLYRNESEVFEDGKYFPDLVVREAVRFLRENRSRPFFLYLPLNLPHYPEQPDPEIARRYAHLRMPRRSEAAMLATLDDRVGRVLRTVDELNLRENTMIVFLSDNGHSTEDHRGRDGVAYGSNGGGGNTGRFRGAKNSFFEGGIRVPFLISLPGRVPQGEVRDQPVMEIDVLPTVLEACRVPLPDRKIDGANLFPVLASARAPAVRTEMHWQWQNQWAVRDDQWKLIVNCRDTTGKDSPHWRATPPDPVYLANLADDPPESRNRADEHPALVSRLRQVHERWAADVFGATAKEQ
jgi:arylsulfatase A-like enzyme